AARQGGWAAGARAMVAKRRAWLGPEGTADADRLARRHGYLRQRHGLGIGILHCQSYGRAADHGPAPSRDPLPTAGGVAHGARSPLVQLRDPLQIPQRPDDLSSPRDDTVPFVVDPDTRPDSKHVC